MFLDDYIIILYIMKTQEVPFSVRRFLGNVRSIIALRRKELFEDSREEKKPYSSFTRYSSFVFFFCFTFFIFNS